MRATFPFPTAPTGNRLLDAVPPGERARLLANAAVVNLALHESLCRPGERLTNVYFPISSVVSLLTRVSGTSGIEIATVGMEGMVGLPVSWDSPLLNPRDFFHVQVPGRAVRLDSATFIDALGMRQGLAAAVHRYTQGYVSQLSQQIACNALHSVAQRCARWLLMTHDRVIGDEFPLTQAFLSQMLGVRRASVTDAAGALQDAGCIRYRRGRVTITDRESLERASCECYEILRSIFFEGIMTGGNPPLS